LAAGAAALPVVPRIAWAQTYPKRSVRIVVGFPPGGGADITARLIGQWLSERLGQPFIIENRPGGGTNIATEAVVRAPADVGPLPAAIEYIRAGKLRALAVTTAARSEALPDIATVAEFVPDYEASVWAGLSKTRSGAGWKKKQNWPERKNSVERDWSKNLLSGRKSPRTKRFSLWGPV
jgi:tripartite-type tricarboxylate transporter receptor subunit TctC